MKKRRSIKQMIWYTVAFFIAASVVGYFQYEDARTTEELNQDIRGAAQRGYMPKGEVK